MSVREIYRAEQLPTFQNLMYSAKDKAVNCVKGDVVLVRDLDTGLIYNQMFQPELMNYDANYQNEQAVSAVFKSHLNDVSSIIFKYFEGDRLIEVGCGKGYFLEHLLSKGFSIVGVDPTYEGDNSEVITEFFSPDLGIESDGIVLRHVLEHIVDPIEFLQGVLAANGGKGKVYIEVPCFDWICQRRAWFDVFYEHVNYFRINDFYRIFTNVISAGHIFGGQYIFVVADLSSLVVPKYETGDQFSFPADFLDSVEYCKGLIDATCENGLRSKSNIVWGGASKGVIFSLFMQRLSVDIDYVVDINSAKQGKYLAGTGLKVCSPDEVLLRVDRGSNIFVMNSNYLAEIKSMTNNMFQYIVVDNEKI